MFFYLFLLFVLLPWLELYLLFRVHELVGWGQTLALVLLTGVVGAALAKWQGLDALRRIQTAMREGRVPAGELLDGFLIFAAGLLLITPGLLTDSAGFLLLVPPARRVIRRWIVQWARRHIQVSTEANGGRGPFGPGPPDPDVIDVSATPLDDDGE
ncbi:MAG: FxsA family protein [Kiritimatiellaeota bacterium]|nr:FxsA family protein [Kiritimatiellota bacterium]